MFLDNKICLNYKKRYGIAFNLELNKRYKRSAFISFEDPGADPGFQVRGDALKKNALSEAGAKILGVFRVKNHDFTPKNHIFFNFRGARAGCANPPPPLDPPLGPVCQFPLGQIMKTYMLTSKTDLNVLFFHCQLL